MANEGWWALKLFASGTVGSAIGSTVAFFVKDWWTRKNKRAAEIDKAERAARLKFIERQLSEFYWPLWMRLERDNTVWSKLLQKRDRDEKIANIARDLEKDFILPNHEAASDLITEKMHLLGKDPEDELRKLLVAYVKHVAVYRALRASGDDDSFPKAHDANFPNKLFRLLEDRARLIQSDYDKLLGESKGGA